MLELFNKNGNKKNVAEESDLCVAKLYIKNIGDIPSGYTKIAIESIPAISSYTRVCLGIRFSGTGSSALHCQCFDISGSDMNVYIQNINSTKATGITIAISMLYIKTPYYENVYL